MNNNPLIVFCLWIGEVFFTMILSVHLDFDMNDFRVWSTWALAIFLGVMQFTINRKNFKTSVIDWWREAFKKK